MYTAVLNYHDAYPRHALVSTITCLHCQWGLSETLKPSLIVTTSTPGWPLAPHTSGKRKYAPIS
jgi:hypothetical protein